MRPGGARRNPQLSFREGGIISRKHRPDYMIILFMGMLMLVGLVVMFAIGPQRANLLNTIHGFEYSDSYFFVRQLLNLLVAAAAFAAAALIPLAFWQKHARTLLIAAIVASVLLSLLGALGAGIVQCSLGACRWFDFGLFTVQPAEFLKFAILLFGAGFLGMRAKQGLINDKEKTIIPVVVVAVVSALLVIGFQKDMGTGIALIAIIATMLLVGGVSARTGLLLFSGIVALGLLLIVIAPHRMERITTFFGGDAVSVDDPGAYHIAHAKIAIGTGGLLGVGIGNGIQATGYLPEAINDSVFAVMGETFGFVGLVVILFLFTGLLMRILRTMDSLVDIRQRLIVAGVLGWFAAHVILNVAAMIGVFPLTGITLPLLSFGGTSMLFIAAALGLVFQLSAYTVHESKVREVENENSGSWRGIGRSRDAGRRRASRA